MQWLLFVLLIYLNRLSSEMLQRFEEEENIQTDVCLAVSLQSECLEGEVEGGRGGGLVQYRGVGGAAGEGQ